VDVGGQLHVHHHAGSFIQVSAGLGFDNGCGIDAPMGGAGSVVCWGNDRGLVRNKPAGKFTSVSVGGDGNTTQIEFGCALRPNHAVVCWGSHAHGLNKPPLGSFKEVTSGGTFACGLRQSGTVTCWGANPAVPAGSFTHVSVGAGWERNFGCAIRTSGRVLCWGSHLGNLGYPDDQIYPPAGRFSQISAGIYGACGLRPNGSIACWGEATGPAGQGFLSVSTGQGFACGLRRDHVVVCESNKGKPGLYVQVSVGQTDFCGVETSGGIRCWGSLTVRIPASS
jgi:hypothetical protein